MLFNTFHFALFLLAVVPLHFMLPHRWRWCLLLAASCYFYMALIPVYILILGLSIAIDYVAGILIENAAQPRRKIYLAVSIVANISLLAVFKYFNFFNANVEGLARFLHWNYSIEALQLILPVGLSFHTFQAMAYTIEVYRGQQKAERHLGIYALYIMFFPQLVAGPIERPQNMLHQFRQNHPLDVGRWASGLRWMLWGLFKKVAVADLVAPVVRSVFGSGDAGTPLQFDGPVLAVATVFFAIQIYCDFSGYSDIAIGVARLLGYDLMTNFRQPYFSRSIGEFWRRWHISLSTWFRDYLYIPLGGSRVSAFRHAANLMIVFAVSGLWHGANWTFVVWGVLHGAYLVAGQALAPVRQAVSSALGLTRVPRVLAAGQTAWIFLLVAIGWVFFVSKSLGDAVHVLTHAHHLHSFLFADLFALGLPRFEMCTAVIAVATVMGVDWALAMQPVAVQAWWRKRSFRWACLAGCFYLIVFVGVFGKVSFIYFQIGRASCRERV